MSGKGELWEVVGGSKTGGVLVRFGVDKDSPAHKERIATGAVVRQLKLSGERLQFEKVSGEGPESGWVSIKLKDADLLVRSNPVVEVDAAAPAIQAGFLEFPKDFVFGVATAAYQIEGAADEGGRTPSIWDEFCQTEGNTEGGASGAIACDHYHRWRDDVKLISHLGVDAYRFSISWSRLIPSGEGEANPEGVAFYNGIIDALLERNITPWVTLYHWDLPVRLHYSFGGWLGAKERIMSAFGAYARTCFQLFGDRVKRWFTINEPWCCSVLGFLDGKFAPGFQEARASDLPMGAQEYACAHNMILAHAEAVQIYRSEFKTIQGGQIGIVLNADYKHPMNPSKSMDITAAERALDFNLGWFASPIWLGDYPSSMVEFVKGRLPRFTPEEKKIVKGSSDFFGLNSYQAGFALNLKAAKEQGLITNMVGYHGDSASYTLPDEGWATTDMGWAICPWGLRELLLHIQKKYKPAGGIIITENGTAHEAAQSAEADKREGALVPQPYIDDGVPPEDYEKETYEDPDRVRFFKAHLSAVHAARAQGADVRGYFAWSLMDNFEWNDGYGPRFGVVRVDYQTQKRTIKTSARFLADAVRRRGFEAPPKSEQYPGRVF